MLNGGDEGAGLPRDAYGVPPIPEEDDSEDSFSQNFQPAADAASQTNIDAKTPSAANDASGNDRRSMSFSS